MTSQDTGADADRLIVTKSEPSQVGVRAQRGSYLGKCFRLLWGAFIKLVFGLTSFLAVLVIVISAYQSLTRRIIVIAPISVPKIFQENGYTSDVASKRLRDALTKYVAATHTPGLEDSEIGLQSELPEIVVPTVGLSLDTIAAWIRGVLGLDQQRNIGGEFIASGGQLWLRLRLNGREFYSGNKDIQPEHPDPDTLLAKAAPMLFEATQPIIVAVAHRRNNPEKALERAKRIIGEHQEPDENVVRAHVLVAAIYYDRQEYARSRATLATAIELKRDHAQAHLLLGNVLKKEGKLDKAIEHYRKAIEINPKYGAAHNQLGVALVRRNLDEAIVEYRKAIFIDPKDVVARTNLGFALNQQKKRDLAIAQYGSAIEVDAKYAPAHYHLGNAFRDEGRHDEAIKHYREAIKIDARNASAYNNLGRVLRDQGQYDEAIAQFRKAIEIDPKFTAARMNLEAAVAVGLEITPP